MRQNINRQIKKGFTLIELLVVIAIIGILAGMVVVNMTGASESAKIAKGLSFSSAMQHKMVMSCVGNWNFDNQDASDSSGQNNNGIITSATFSGDTPYGNNIGNQYSLNLDGVNGYVDCGNNTVFDCTNEITLSAWVKQGTGGTGYEIPLAKLSSYFLGARYANKATFGLFFTDATSYYLRSSDLPSSWLGAWHLLVGTYDGSTMKLYIDGTLNNQYSVSKVIRTTTSDVILGRWSTGDKFNGSVDDVRIYSRSLSSDQVSEYYRSTFGRYAGRQ